MMCCTVLYYSYTVLYYSYTVLYRWECRADECKTVLQSRVKLVLHIRRAHSRTALEYFRQHKDSLTTEIQHTCQLCATSILWDSYYLREHLRIKHKMKMVTYKNKFVNNYDEKITGKDFNYECWSFVYH